IQGAFPAGRPSWEDAGARIVEDVLPFEQRKLWLLNGSHSLLAYAGTILGHETVADAISDPSCRALLARFANPNIRHALAQIAADGSQKIPVRIVPTIRAERAAGRVPVAAARVVGAWTAHLRGLGTPLKDARADEVAALGAGTVQESVDAVLAFLGADLAADAELRDVIVGHVQDLASRAAR
ncbi:MAG: hypothetical protein MUF35_12610, partial [Candidatus Nanopelagicales bacterium]|nr:hypothetical protein [Candidatus Nanopelagicales bacterium]